MSEQKTITVGRDFTVSLFDTGFYEIELTITEKNNDELPKGQTIENTVLLDSSSAFFLLEALTNILANQFRQHKSSEVLE